MSTNRPESGRSDQSALAVTWNSTMRPAPRACCVTSGVPSASCAQVWLASFAPGSASTCWFTRTSAGTASPAKGESAAKGASAAGWLQDIAPPSCRSPASRRTGSRLSGCSAVCGPAKRSSSPPLSTHLAIRSCSGPSATTRSASTSTEIWRESSCSSPPSRSSA